MDGNGMALSEVGQKGGEARATPTPTSLPIGLTSLRASASAAEMASKQVAAMVHAASTTAMTTAPTALAGEFRAAAVQGAGLWSSKSEPAVAKIDAAPGAGACAAKGRVHPLFSEEEGSRTPAIGVVRTLGQKRDCGGQELRCTGSDMSLASRDGGEGAAETFALVSPKEPSRKRSRSKLSQYREGGETCGVDLTDPLATASNVAAGVVSAALLPSHDFRPTKAEAGSLEDFILGVVRGRGHDASPIRPKDDRRRYVPSSKDVSDYDLDMIAAIRSGDAAQLAMRLEAGKSVNACNRFGESILHMAARAGNADLVQLLVEAGASVWAVDDMGRTPLHDACWTPSPALGVARVLLLREPDLVRTKDARNQSPFTYVSPAHTEYWKTFIHEVAGRCWPAAME